MAMTLPSRLRDHIFAPRSSDLGHTMRFRA